MSDKKMHQPPPIAGYKPLSQEQVDLMNRIKAQGVELSVLLAEIGRHIITQRNEALAANDADAMQANLRAEPERWLAMGRTDLQTALMKLTRAVAQPGFL